MTLSRKAVANSGLKMGGFKVTDGLSCHCLTKMPSSFLQSISAAKVNQGLPGMLMLRDLRKISAIIAMMNISALTVSPLISSSARVQIQIFLLSLKQMYLIPSCLILLSCLSLLFQNVSTEYRATNGPMTGIQPALSRTTVYIHSIQSCAASTYLWE